MNYTSSYHQIYLKETTKDQFVSRGAGFQTLNFVFGVEFLIMYIRGLRFYLARLKEMGITNKTFEDDFLKIFATAILNVEYPPESLLEFTTRLYDYMLQAKELYSLMCKKNNLKEKKYEIILSDPRTLTFAEMIKEGQNDFLAKYQTFNSEQMNFVELYMNPLKSIAIHFIELKALGIHDEKAYDYVTFLFSMKPIIEGEAFQKVIQDLAEINNHLIMRIYEAKKERYGEIEPTEISTSIRPNKAILVSGSNLAELEMLLDATKDKGIDIYTHGNMLSAHIYPKFKTYSHFIGHFSEESESYLVDFSNFPGAIFLTRHSFLNVEKFYQGRLYTTDTIAPLNVNLIKDNNFESLIQSALRSEGFTEVIEKPSIKFNFSEKEFIDKITEVVEKMEKGEIKHFFVLEVPNHKMQKEYFEKFLKLLGRDCFVLSFYHFTKEDNILYIKPDYIAPLLYKTLDLFKNNMSIEQIDPIILYTRCEMHMISNIMYMKKLGIKKIYYADCLANLINPALIEVMKEMFGIKSYTNPKDDLKDMLEK